MTTRSANTKGKESLNQRGLALAFICITQSGIDQRLCRNVPCPPLSRPSPHRGKYDDGKNVCKRDDIVRQVLRRAQQVLLYNEGDSAKN